MSIFLGLDISSSCVGVALVESIDGKIIKIDTIDLKNKNYFPDLYAKAERVKNYLLDLKCEFSINSVYIESPLLMFHTGKSSAHAISVLTKFNGIVSWLCKEQLNIVPIHISASSARKICGIKTIKGKKAKECVMNFLLEKEEEFSKIIEFSKKGNIVPKYYDMADAFIIAKTAYYLNKDK